MRPLAELYDCAVLYSETVINHTHRSVHENWKKNTISKDHRFP